MLGENLSVSKNCRKGREYNGKGNNHQSDNFSTRKTNGRNHGDGERQSSLKYHLMFAWFRCRAFALLTNELVLDQKSVFLLVSKAELVSAHFALDWF